MKSSIQIEGLTKNYEDKQVLRGIDLETPPGHILGYIGPNGAGKTTTVKILIGMLDGFGGRATVCGHNVATEPLEVKRRIGYVPESAALYDTLTPMEYLRFIGRIHGMDEPLIETRVEAMLDLFELGAERDQRLATFSKGMRQKVLIVAGMMHDPEVLFLDEPLSGLDANSALVVKEILAQLAGRGKTIFYCSHVMDVVERVCDRIVILAEGRIVADGSFEELQKMRKGDSLERIFTELTGTGREALVADRFVNALTPEQARD